jgi:hypothetical protein
MRRQGYRPGDHKIVCDRTGFTVWASETTREWTGAVVRGGSYEPRHPQDFVRAKRDQQAVPDPRPPEIERFQGPLTTEVEEAAAAGTHTLVVCTTLRMQAGDAIGILLDSGDLHRTIILSLESDNRTMTIRDALPGATSPGKWVIDYTAVSPTPA